jgi:rhodanese-related sulfurtransferase
MVTVSPRKASKYFAAKMNFTTGPVELNELIKKHESIKIIDVRAAEDFAQGHIPGAVNLPKEKWETFTGLSRNDTNVIYCYSEVCHLAPGAAKFFAEHGYPVMELEGGFEHWQRHDLPVES